MLYHRNMDRHKLTNVNWESRTAICRVCGPTLIHVPEKNAQLKRCCIKQWESRLGRRSDIRRKGKKEGHIYVNHMILSLDRETMIGKCRLCGEVEVKLVDKGKHLMCINKWLTVRDTTAGHKLTRHEATEMVRIAGVCQNPGCGNRLNGPGRGDHGGQVDHDHATGIIRGVLCGTCNLTLGAARDKVEVLLGLIEYLTNPPGYHPS